MQTDRSRFDDVPVPGLSAGWILRVRADAQTIS